MEGVFDVVVGGTGSWVFAVFLIRVLLGLFFMISGYHKLANSKRHQQFVETLRRCGVPMLWFFQWFVAGVEFTGGAALVLGILTPLAATGVMFVCVIAAATDGVMRVTLMRPIDRADYLDDILYLPEVLYVLMLGTVIVAGSGPLSMDAVVLSMLRAHT